MNVLRSGKVKTRKDHVCHGCLEKVPKGTEMYSQTITDEGTVYTLYMCNDCTDWCHRIRHCRECNENECAFEGYVRDCKKEFNYSN